MSITVDWPLDPLELPDRIADGWLNPTLWVSDAPEGPFTLVSVTPAPATLAAALAAKEYNFEFVCTVQSPAQHFKVRYYDGVDYSALSEAATFTGGGGTTLTRLRQMLGKRIRDLWMNTTTSASGSAALANCNEFHVTKYPDSYFKGGFFNRLGTSEVTQISAFTKVGGVFTLSPAFSTNVGTGLTFEVTKRWGPDEYRDAINWAIANAYPYLNRDIVIPGSLTIADQREYQVPQEILSLSGVQMESFLNPDSTEANVRGLPWEDLPFKPVNPGNSRTIEFFRDLPADRRLRYLGTGRLSAVYNDTDYVECFQPQTELIIYLAANILYTQFAPEAASSDTDRWDKLAAGWMALYEAHKNDFGMPRRGQMIWGWDSWQSRAKPSRRSLLGIAQ